MKIKTNIILFHTPTSAFPPLMNRDDREVFRDWAIKELQQKFPNHEASVSYHEGFHKVGGGLLFNTFACRTGDLEKADKIEDFTLALWQRYPERERFSGVWKTHSSLGRITDADTGDAYHTVIAIRDGDVLSVSFGTSFRVVLSAEDAGRFSRELLKVAAVLEQGLKQ